MLAGGLERFPFFTVRKVDAPNERGFVEARICCCSAGIVVGEQAWRECNVRVGSMITVWCGAKMVEWEMMEMFYSSGGLTSVWQMLLAAGWVLGSVHPSL